jgi:hypothetical protein
VRSLRIIGVFLLAIAALLAFLYFAFFWLSLSHFEVGEDELFQLFLLLL